MYIYAESPTAGTKQCRPRIIRVEIIRIGVVRRVCIVTIYYVELAWLLGGVMEIEVSNSVIEKTLGSYRWADKFLHVVPGKISI